MRIREGEARRRVVKSRRRPRYRIVASRACCDREYRARRRVLRVCCLLPGGQVAPGISAVARLNRQIVVVVDVAVGAGVHLASRCHLVRIRQWETRRAVIESRSRPRDRIVASRAVRDRKYVGRCRMFWIGCLLPRREVTA